MRLMNVLGMIFLVMSGCSQAPQSEVTAFPRDLFPVRQVVIGSNQLSYRVYIPRNHPLTEKLPVMLYLHGSDERGSDNERQLSGPAPTILANPGNFQFIIVFPQCPKGRFWDSEMIDLAIAELDKTVEEFDADESRLYLAGFSLGGYGTWAAASMYPDKFAAIIPMSGRLLPRPAERAHVAPAILQLADADDPYKAFAERLRTTPVWIFHGANDNIVPVDNSRQMARALKSVGNPDARYTELENTGHVSLNAAFGDPRLFEWLASQQNKP
ncbi:MAG: prolyl oligopeptidase family serine peptidase [Acidobacteriota bacterium]